MDYTTLKNRMVGEQLISRGIRDQAVLDAFYKVDRHKFVSDDLKKSSYQDYPLSISQGQTISQPYIVALMTEALELTKTDKVLEIGTGSGYQTAILAELAGQVYSIERLEGLANNAQAMLAELGYTNTHIKIGDGTLGWPQASFFDKILVTAASLRVPIPLGEQLKEQGKMVLPLGEQFAQALTLVHKNNGQLFTEKICDCVFVPLVGKYGLRRD
jgi:protein-L-isoaspartate(D-aspartate) O-methyltransferase